MYHLLGCFNSRISVSASKIKGNCNFVMFVLAHSMAEEIKTVEENFRQQNKSCFVLGASGETGRLLLQELLERNIFSKITLIGRRHLTFEGKAYENLVSELILSSYEGFGNQTDPITRHLCLSY